MDDSWLVRQHRIERKKLFHPAHGFLPFPATALGVERASVRCMKDGRRMVLQNDWKGKAHLQHDEPKKVPPFSRLRWSQPKRRTAAIGQLQATVASAAARSKNTTKVKCPMAATRLWRTRRP